MAVCIGKRESATQARPHRVSPVVVIERPLIELGARHNSGTSRAWSDGYMMLTARVPAAGPHGSTRSGVGEESRPKNQECRVQCESLKA
jgi:hypothetical protein